MRHANPPTRTVYPTGPRGTYPYNTSESWSKRVPVTEQRTVRFGSIYNDPGTISSYERTIERRAVGSSAAASARTTDRSSAATNEERQVMGEMLHRRIAERQPALAGKITAMLLEMETTSILRLLDSPDALGARVNEIVVALRNHAASPGDFSVARK
eukprot:IDg21188t1